jgi:hypothetical protein
MERVEPHHIALFGLHPSSDLPDVFLKRLAGLIQYALRVRSGRVTLGDLAAATGQREITVQWGMDWLVGRGFITRIEVDAGVMNLSAGGMPDLEAQKKAERAVRALLDETAAYREYYLKSEAHTLIASVKTH